MEQYNPQNAPDPDEWQAISEDERIDLVREFHEQAEEEVPDGGENIHAVFHVIVENQIAMNLPPVAATVEKLIRQGLNRHEAIHAVGAVLSGDMHELLHGDKESWEPQQYRRRLEKLTAKRWRKGKW